MSTKSILLALSLTMSSQFASAMIAPWYVQLRVFDAVAISFSKEVVLEPGETMDDVEISSIEVLENGNISIASDAKVCTYSIKTNPLPPGAVGVPGYSAMKIDCDMTDKLLRTSSYEVISERLDKAAKLNKMVKSIVVNKKGALKLTYKN